MRSDALVMIGLALVCGMAASVVVSHWVDGPTTDEPAPTRTERIYIAHLDIGAGQPLHPDALRLEAWDSERVPQGAITRLDDVAGKISRTAIRRGIPIQSILLTAANPLPANGLNPATGPNIDSPPTIHPREPSSTPSPAVIPNDASVASQSTRREARNASPPAEETHLVSAVPESPLASTNAPSTNVPAATEPVTDVPAGTNPVAKAPAGTEPVATESTANVPANTNPTAAEPTPTEPAASPLTAERPNGVAATPPVDDEPMPAERQPADGTPSTVVKSPAVEAPLEAGPSATAAPPAVVDTNTAQNPAAPAEDANMPADLTPTREPSGLTADAGAPTPSQANRPSDLESESAESPISVPVAAERYPRPTNARAAATISDDGWVRIRKATEDGNASDTACHAKGEPGLKTAPKTQPSPPVASRPTNARPSRATGSR